MVVMTTLQCIGGPCTLVTSYKELHGVYYQVGSATALQFIKSAYVRCTFNHLLENANFNCGS